MRLLVLSDIHSNLVAVRRMRAREKNDFDAVVVAGDIGNKGADTFFAIMATFGCPVLYVYGNWDNELGYEDARAPAARLIHHTVVTIGGLHFTGFAGCPTRWGKNPIAVKLGAENDRDQSPRVLELNRAALRKTIAQGGIDPRRTVVVTHERLARLDEIAPGALLHLYGHVHGFADRTLNGTRFVNVSVLDQPVSAHPRGLAEWTRDDLRNYNAGNYVVIEIDKAGDVAVRPVVLPHDYPDWVPLTDRRYRGAAWIPDEKPWTDPADPRLRRFVEPMKGL